jgi:2,3-bisphosphoglycerate-dependent phosphoglycerate mutase
MSEVLKLLLIRHGQSIGNLAGRMPGQDDDQLSALGVQQAQQLAQVLNTEGWHPCHIYSSPLRRAMQTAAILRAGQPLSDRPEIPTLGHLDTMIPEPSCPSDIPITYTTALTELHGGIFQGLTWPEAQAKYPELCHQLESSPTLIPIPGAESAQAGRQRAHQLAMGGFCNTWWLHCWATIGPGILRYATRLSLSFG